MASDVAALLASMRANPQNVRFADACKVADHYFGTARHRGSSHHVWKMAWPGDPRVNMQNDGGKAKRYQVEQLLAAIDRLEAVQTQPKPTGGSSVPEPKSGKSRRRRR